MSTYTEKKIGTFFTGNIKQFYIRVQLKHAHRNENYNF